MNNLLWKTKLAARIHDPAEKALVLLRDPAGHEGGTSLVLKRLLGLDQLPDTIAPDNDEALSRVVLKKGLSREIYRHVQRADWWAAAADRPQWPMREINVSTKAGEQRVLSVAPWAQVRWVESPVLIHPLTGEQFDLGRHGGLAGTDFHDIKERSLAHFSRLLKDLDAQEGDARDLRKVLLAFWRFGPELSEQSDNGRLGALWKLLPADTRVPDHSIWDHLDLTSAFAGAFAADADGEAALLSLSLGPVQSFIAAARKMDDLWAGSHLLSRLAWEAMRPLCEAFGPDAILFPRLRGIPQVDLWLRDQMDLPDELFKDCEWMKGGTDANPLFSAALPNRFVAVVPASQARQIAEAAQLHVRNWLQQLGVDVVSRLLHMAGLDVESTTTPYEQMKVQLEGFPEVHWAVVPFSLVTPRNKAKQTGLDVTALSESMAPFFGTEAGKPCGFLDTPAWKILQKEIDWGDNTTFFAPNPGVLYPAVYELAERVHAAARTSRAFDQIAQKGWRCSLTGEGEWLTDNPDHLTVPAGKRRSRTDRRYKEGEHVETLWTKLADKKPSWAKKGEHLGAASALKRLWPTIFSEEVEKATGREIGRFVVSTHTMALAHQLDQWLKAGARADSDLASILQRFQPEAVALPRKLMQHQSSEGFGQAKRIPALLDVTTDEEVQESAVARIRRQVRRTLAQGRNTGEEIRLETYYALIMMDGDRLGAILSGDESTDTTIRYRESFHPQVREGFDKHAALQEQVRRFGEQKRAVSPNRHLAVSGALNDFSQTIVRHVVENEHLGRVIYAGGDDVLASLPVADLLSTMQRLRHAYSGIDPDHEGGVWQGLTLRGGFAALRQGERLKVMRLMGKYATASCGAVIAHHQAPLPAVMRELRMAEKRAKTEGGRDAFSLTVIKRSGGALFLTDRWGEPMKLLVNLVAFLRDKSVSRRAVYHSLEWLQDLPDPKGKPDMLESLIAYQFARQSGGANKEQASSLARRLAELTAGREREGLKWLENFLAVAEFLAREARDGGDV